ncbi:glycosyltransferase family 2 protein [Hwangdonia lutea]|uniref:Glycosyltransferase family 2 protein n=1 Tax=Hwangdonia lutea TaxID=3075823 RepID=A0AA97ENU2_9FLAO|nr:glycosyltransferase family 2 protein [Hwangdonia sp. SCSIO 19198]WOD43418.1 glycosyltransferase family 2 protein [Hwangdonia sp. SCSIO 19198]
MNNPPLVSVIIPTYNRVKIVGNAIKSVLNQTYSNIEIIVVDDGSTDETKALIDNFTMVKYIAKPNGGQASARNLGLKHANGKYIASLDSDDLWETSFLTKMVGALEKHDLDFAFANWGQQNNNGDYSDFLSEYVYLPAHIPKKKDSWVYLSYKDLRKIYLAACPSPSSSLLIRASAIKRGWNENMNIADDWYLLLDIVLPKEAKVAFTTEKLWKKHVVSDNVFDGRDKLEVLKLLYVEDMSAMLKGFKSVLNDKEIEALEKKYVLDLILTAKEVWSKEKSIKNAFYYIFKACSKHPIYFLQIIFKVAFGKIKNKNLKKTDIILE